MSSDSLTIVFAVCDDDGEIDAEYGDALGLSRTTYDCELVIGVKRQDPSIVSSHLTVIVPRNPELKNGATQSSALARALIRLKSTDVGSRKKSTNPLQSACPKVDVSFPKQRKKTRLGPTTQILVKWAKDDSERDSLYDEARSYAGKLPNERAVEGHEFLGYYEVLTRSGVFAVALFK